MEPVPETVEAVEALAALDPATDPDDLLADLKGLAHRAREVVPDLVGVSIGRLDQGLTFTLVATAAEMAVLDAVQYVAGGPCVDGAHRERVEQYDDDVLDEERWRMFAEATAARAVRSTLTLPVLRGDDVVGTVNLYAASRRAFADRHEDLAEIFGAWAAGAVANADLSFTTREQAARAPQRVEDQGVIDVAIGIVATDLGVDLDTAEERLQRAAVRAGVTLAELARDIVDARRNR